MQISNIQTISNASEDDDSDGGFKYIKHYSAQQLNNISSKQLRDAINRKKCKTEGSASNQHRSRAKVKLHQSYSSGSQRSDTYASKV